MSTKAKTFLPLVCLATFLSSRLLGGVVITMESKSLQDPPSVSTQKIFVQDNGLRTDISAGTTLTRTVIFRGDKKVLWALDPEKHSYIEMTEADLEKLSGVIDQAKKQMESMLSQMPPEQRAMMESMMKQQMEQLSHTGPKTPLKFEKGDKDQKVGQWSCQHYLGKRGSTLEQEVWASDSNLNGALEEMEKIFKSFESFLDKLQAQTQNFAGSPKNSFDLFETRKALGAYTKGIPIRTIQYNKGAQVHQATLQSIEKRTLEPSLFEIPSGYTKQSLPTPELPNSH